MGLLLVLMLMLRTLTESLLLLLSLAAAARPPPNTRLMSVEPALSVSGEAAAAGVVTDGPDAMLLAALRLFKLLLRLLLVD